MCIKECTYWSNRTDRSNRSNRTYGTHRRYRDRRYRWSGRSNRGNRHDRSYRSDWYSRYNPSRNSDDRGTGDQRRSHKSRG